MMVCGQVGTGSGSQGGQVGDVVSSCGSVVSGQFTTGQDDVGGCVHGAQVVGCSGGVAMVSGHMGGIGQERQLGVGKSGVDGASGQTGQVLATGTGIAAIKNKII